MLEVRTTLLEAAGARRVRTLGRSLLSCLHPRKAVHDAAPAPHQLLVALALGRLRKVLGAR